MSDASAGAEIAVICGPTAAGKSAIAMWIAERTRATIISADSRQIYRGFDIGTAKPTAAERGQTPESDPRRTPGAPGTPGAAGVRLRSLTPNEVLIRSAVVPHFGIDVCDATQRYSAAMWAKSADGWIDETLIAERRPLVVGGTGLYLRALFEGLFEEPVLDDERRAALGAFLETLGRDELRRWVTVLDSPRDHLGRTQLLRAVEIALLTGHRVSDLHRDRPRQSRWQPRYLVVDPGAALAERISARIDQMFDNGWPDEVRHLMQTVPEDAPAWNAAGYDAVRRLVRGELSRRAAHEIVLIETRQYAKRQRTWFRHQLPPDRVTRIDPTSADWTRVVERWANLEALS